jgi:hypothetical protein
MQFDIVFAKFLLNKKIPINTVKYILSTVYLLTGLVMYFTVFDKDNSIGGGIVFILVFLFFGVLRSKNLENYLKNRNKL